MSSSADHRETIREILFESDPAAALASALRLADSPPEGWTSALWLMLAEGADSAAHEDCEWWRVAIVAHGRIDSAPTSPAALSAMQKRVNLIIALGPNANDDFRDPDVVFAWFRAIAGNASADRTLALYRRDFDGLFTFPRESSEWSAARDGVLRGRRLREGARLLSRLTERAMLLPHDLASWLGWAELVEAQVAAR